MVAFHEGVDLAQFLSNSSPPINAGGGSITTNLVLIQIKALKFLVPSTVQALVLDPLPDVDVPKACFAGNLLSCGGLACAWCACTHGQHKILTLMATGTLWLPYIKMSESPNRAMNQRSHTEEEGSIRVLDKSTKPLRTWMCMHGCHSAQQEMRAQALPVMRIFGLLRAGAAMVLRAIDKPPPAYTNSNPCPESALMLCTLSVAMSVCTLALLVATRLVSTTEMAWGSRSGFSFLPASCCTHITQHLNTPTLVLERWQMSAATS